jgi:DNA invertase Pin-like site-specific DNA recombinase
MLKVALYARVSTRDKGQSIDNQLPDLRRYAEAHGWKIYKEYSEEESGGSANRTQFQQLFADAHQRRFDLVLFWSLDRFSREEALPTLQHLNKLEQWGVGYKSFTEQYLDSTGMFKDAIVFILATLGKQERVRLSERTKAGLARTKAKGTVLGRKAVAPAVIRQIQALKAEGKSERAVAVALGVSKGVVGKYLKAELTE